MTCRPQNDRLQNNRTTLHDLAVQSQAFMEWFLVMNVNFPKNVKNE